MKCSEFPDNVDVGTGVVTCDHVIDDKGCTDCGNKYRELYCKTPPSGTEKKKQWQRIQIYRKELMCEVGGDSCGMEWVNKQLRIEEGVAIPAKEKNDNFEYLVKNNFYLNTEDRAYNIKTAIEFSDTTEDYLQDIVETSGFYWPRNSFRTTSAYKYLKMYSETPYGAVIFKEIRKETEAKPLGKNFSVNDLKNRIGISYIEVPKDCNKEDYHVELSKEIDFLLNDRFKIFVDEQSGAGGFYNFIKVPKDFPKKGKYCGGEVIDPLAVIHHEIAHTKYGLNQSESSKQNTPSTERGAVLWYENPARVYNLCHEIYGAVHGKYGLEPRYTYVGAEDNNNEKSTVNIICGNTKPGQHTYEKNDPRILRPICNCSVEDGWSITLIPRIMRKNNWHIGAKLMEYWFSREAYTYPDSSNVDKTIEEANCNSSIVTMDWALSFSRVKKEYDMGIRFNQA